MAVTNKVQNNGDICLSVGQCNRCPENERGISKRPETDEEGVKVNCGKTSDTDLAIGRYYSRLLAAEVLDQCR